MFHLNLVGVTDAPAELVVFRPTRYAYDPGWRCNVWFHLLCSPDALISAVHTGRPSWLLFGPVYMLGSLGRAYGWARLVIFGPREYAFGLGRAD